MHYHDLACRLVPVADLMPNLRVLLTLFEFVVKVINFNVVIIVLSALEVRHSERLGEFFLTSMIIM